MLANTRARTSCCVCGPDRPRRGASPDRPHCPYISHSRRWANSSTRNHRNTHHITSFLLFLPRNTSQWSAIQALSSSDKQLLWVTQRSQLERVTNPEKALAQSLFRVARMENPSARLTTLDVAEAEGAETGWYTSLVRCLADVATWPGRGSWLPGSGGGPQSGYVDPRVG